MSKYVTVSNSTVGKSVSVVGGLDHFLGDFVVKVDEYALELTRVGLDPVEKSQKIGKYSDGRSRIVVQTQLIPLGRLYLDEDESDEDHFIFYFDDNRNVFKERHW